MRYNLGICVFMARGERHMAVSYAPAGCHDLEDQPCNASYWIVPGMLEEDDYGTV